MAEKKPPEIQLTILHLFRKFFEIVPIIEEIDIGRIDILFPSISPGLDLNHKSCPIYLFNKKIAKSFPTFETALKK